MLSPHRRFHGNGAHEQSCGSIEVLITSFLFPCPPVRQDDCAVFTQCWLSPADAAWVSGTVIAATAAEGGFPPPRPPPLPGASGTKGGVDLGVAPAKLRGIGHFTVRAASSEGGASVHGFPVVHRGAIATAFDHLLGACNVYVRAEKRRRKKTRPCTDLIYH